MKDSLWSLLKQPAIIIGLALTATYIVWGTSFDTGALSKEFSGSYAAEISATGQTKEFYLTAKESETTLTDGSVVSVWSYNGEIPGPELRVTKGDTIKVTFSNELPQETTIHWHGVRVPNAMDGVPGVTQPPVQPGETFVYEFTPKDAGSFWYHPHVRASEQIERGLYGVVIVEDPNDPEYDQDLTMVIDDWRLLEDGQIDPRFNTGHDLAHDGRWGQTITVNGQRNYEVLARPGERLRLRLVNTSNGRVYKTNFDTLAAKVIAVDGMKVKTSFPAHGFELAPGNRLDVDISVPATDKDGFFLITDSFSRRTNYLAAIKVSGEPIPQKLFSPPLAEHMPEWKEADSKPVTKEYVLAARRGGKYGIEWTMNGKAFPNFEPISLKSGEFSKLRFTNSSSRLHPMHLHGQFFKVVARNDEPVDEPYWRDTVLVHPKEKVDIAMVPLDPGSWVNHCHALEHAEAGMVTVVNVL